MNFFKVILWMNLALFPELCLASNPSDTAQVNALVRKGLSLARSASYDSSFYYYSQAAELAKSSNYLIGQVACYYGFGLIEHFKRNLEPALEQYQFGLAIAEQVENQADSVISKLYNNLGGVYIDLGYRLKGREYLEKAIQLDQIIFDKPHIAIATTHYNMGLVDMYLGENQSALHHFMQAYPLYIETYGENGARVAQLYTNIGILHRDLGNIEQAEDYFNQAANIHLENHGPDYWNLAFPYFNLGVMYMNLGERKKGLEYQLRVLELSKKNPIQLLRLEGIFNGALAKYYVEEGDFEKSRAYADEAIRIFEENYYQGHPRISEFYQFIAEGQVKQGNYLAANEWFDKAKAITIAAYGTIHPQITRIYLQQSKVYLENRNYHRALEAAQKALISMTPGFESLDPIHNPELDQVLNPQLLMHILSQKGAIYAGLAKGEEKITFLLKGLEQYHATTEIIDHLRRGFLSESSKLFLQENAVKVYEKALELCYRLYEMTKEQKYLGNAFFFMEKSKSSVLSEALQASQVTTIQGVSTSTLESEAELIRQIKSLELKLADAQIESDDSLQNTLKKQLFRVRASVDSLEDVIRIQNPDYHQLKYNMEVVNFDLAREELEDKSLVLSFFEGESTWYVLSFSSSDTYLYKVPKSALPIAQLQRFRRLISDQSSQPKDFLTVGAEIYRSFIHPSLQYHSQADRLIIIPDGILAYLPFDALAFKPEAGTAGDAPQYLIETFTVSYRNSMTLYHQQQLLEHSYHQPYIGFAPYYQGTFVATADPAPVREEFSTLTGTREEVEAAGTIFKGLKFLDSAATEANFKKLSQSTSILHLAMHALIDDEDPMKSRLIFSQHDKSLEDGSLNAYEIYQLPLTAELAVLSACNTGTGKINRGEGVLSISRAFMYAGCPNIVMSLWRAQDQPSAEIMKTFFSRLKQGAPKDRALREAKLSYLAQADPFKSHPANWATFVLLGDSQPLSASSKNLAWPIVIIAITTAVILLLRKKSYQTKRGN